METLDGIVIGAGHNGLICAAYLARAGLKVAVIERNPEIGGGTTTEEVTLPGFRHNLHANYHIGIIDSPWLRDLELHRFGLSYILPPVQHAMTLTCPLSRPIQSESRAKILTLKLDRFRGAGHRTDFP